ncbi:MAG: hypothetical protein AABX47_00495 [Nanoarchaeota archaeon]
MPVVGFTFTKMHVEKTEAPVTNVKLNTNMGITGVERVPLTLGASKEEALKLNFNFSSAFEPKLGLVQLDGFLLYIDSKDALGSIEKTWKKDKKLPKDLNNQLLNHIHGKCAIQSVTLTKDIGLPPPIPLPRLSFDEKSK